MRLEVGHLRPKDRVLSGGNDALLRAQAELFGTTRDRKRKFEVLKGLPVLDDLVCKPILCRDGSNSNIWKRPPPHKEFLMEAVELRNKEGSSLVLLRDCVLRAASTSSPYMSL